MDRPYYFPGNLEGTVVKTENGWEPAYRQRDSGDEFFIEPGFAKPTRREAVDAMEQEAGIACNIEAAERIYQAQYASACGYHD